MQTEVVEDNSQLSVDELWTIREGAKQRWLRAIVAYKNAWSTSKPYYIIKPLLDDKRIQEKAYWAWDELYQKALKA